MSIVKYSIIFILSGYLHPSRHIRDKLPSAAQGHRLDNFRVVRTEGQKVSRKEQQVIFIHNGGVKD